MPEQTTEENEVAKLIVNTLSLEEINADDINPEEALFRDGLGLDSIDALEISMAITQTYHFQFRSDNPDIIKIFSSLRSLTEHILKNKK